MQLGLVVGTAISTVKHASMHGWKLLIVQPMMNDAATPDGDPQLAVDTLGAGRGERVIITSDGRSTRELLKNNNTPVRWCVMGIADDLPTHVLDGLQSNDPGVATNA